MKQTAVIILLVLILSSLKVFAQINESDTAKFQMRISGTGNYQEGNVEVLTLKGRLDLSIAAFKNWVFKSQNNSLYQEFYHKQADNDLFSRNYIYFQPQRRIYPFAIGYISTNYRRKIDSRYFAGLGGTVQLINQPGLVWKASASVVYESTRFSGQLFNIPFYDYHSTIQLARATLYSGGWAYLLNNRFRISYDVYWQPAFDNVRNFRWQGDVGADIGLWKGLSFTSSFAYTHENVVVQGIKQDDRMLTFGLAYFLKMIK